MKYHKKQNAAFMAVKSKLHPLLTGINILYSHTVSPDKAKAAADHLIWFI